MAEEEALDKLEELLHVQWDGKVTWSQRKLRKTSCITDMKNYPFDQQRCFIILQSDSYSDNEIDLVPIYKEGVNLLAKRKNDRGRKYVLGKYIQVNR